MHVFIGSDHGGFAQKQYLVEALNQAGYEITDCGDYNTEADDYPDFALAVGRSVLNSKEHRGILLCRSGEGMAMAANKLPGIRAALVWKKEVAAETRNDNDANILVLPSDFVSNEEALDISKAFLATDFSGIDRHQRRIDKIANIERGRYEN